MENPYLIAYRPKSLDANRELEIVYSENYTAALFKWIDENKHTGNHFSSYFREALTSDQVEEFKNDYDSFKKRTL